MDNGHYTSFGWKTPNSDTTGVWETVSEAEYDELKSVTEDSIDE